MGHPTLLNLAEELGNVSKACKVMGVSRDTFYRYRELTEQSGVDALINRSCRGPNLKTEPMRQQNGLSLIMTLMSSTEPVMNYEKRGCLSPKVAFVPSGYVTHWKTSGSA